MRRLFASALAAHELIAAAFTVWIGRQYSFRRCPTPSFPLTAMVVAALLFMAVHSLPTSTCCPIPSVHTAMFGMFGCFWRLKLVEGAQRTVADGQFGHQFGRSMRSLLDCGHHIVCPHRGDGLQLDVRVLVLIIHVVEVLIARVIPRDLAETVKVRRVLLWRQRVVNRRGPTFKHSASCNVPFKFPQKTHRRSMSTDFRIRPL